MHFIIDSDDGKSIKGWLAPDNPSTSPSFTIIRPGFPEISVEANVMRAGIRDMGLHATGMCGFDINGAHVPDIEHADDLEILEAETRLPIYRRFQKGRHIEKKLFVFDASLTPQRRLTERVRDSFSLTYSNVEHQGLETTIALITNPFSQSIYISGRPLLLRYDHFLKDKGYIRAALLREPYEELAERLIFLRLAANEDALSSLMRYATGVESLIDFARDLPINDHRAMIRAFRDITDKQRFELSSPMTRVFGCDIDEYPRRSNVARALENLSSLQVVGTRSDFHGFKELVAGRVGADVFGPGAPATFRSVETFAEKLARVGPVTDLLADDLALYEFVEKAVVEGMENARAGVEN